MNMFSWESGLITHCGGWPADGSVHVAESEKERRPAPLRERHDRIGETMRKRRGREKGSTDCSGGIEGLPLQLLIMVVIAGLGLTIVMGWMNSIAAPHSIGDVFVTPSEIFVFDTNGDGLYTAEGLIIAVTVTDEGGDRLEGATVVLDGANIMMGDGTLPRGVTDSRGQVVFTGLSVEHFGSKLTTVTVTVAKGDYGIDSSYEIPVIPS